MWFRLGEAPTGERRTGEPLDRPDQTYNVGRVLARLPKLLIVLALACSIGLHWALLQVVAWTGMVISYAQDRPVTTAVADTFDGQHPCKLCKGIAKGKSAEKKAEFQLESSKVKFANEAAAFVFSMPPMLWEIAPRDENAEFLTHAPPVPPPRPVLG